MPWAILSVAVLYTLPVRVYARAQAGRGGILYRLVIGLYGLDFVFSGKLHGKSGRGSSIFGWIRRLYDLAPVRAFDFRARVGMEDACLTALAAALLGAGFCALPLPARVRVEPVFHRRTFMLSARCILCFRLGDIMRAGILVLAEKRRVKQQDG